MSVVYLHIGMPKTGTSALQMFLPLNNSILHEAGVDYPLMPFRFKNIGPRRNGHFLTLWNEKEEAPEWEKGFEVVADSLSKYERVILSDENMWTRQMDDGFWEEVLSRLRGLGAEVFVVAYLRSQDDQVESNWNQKVKDQKTRITTSFEDFMKEGMYLYMPFSYGEVLDRISSYVGRDHLIVRVYEKCQFVGEDLFADFLDIIGLSFSEEYELPDFAANVRLPNSAVEVKRMINFAYEGEEIPDFYRDIISKVFGMKQIKEAPEHKTSMFSEELRNSFMSEFAEQNAYVARKYLNREDGILFYGHNPPLPKWQMDDHQILLDMIRIFAAEGVFLYKRQRELEAKNKELEEKLSKLEKSSEGKNKELSGRVEEVYNSLPFRMYRKMRDKKDGKKDE